MNKFQHSLSTRPSLAGKGDGDDDDEDAKYVVCWGKVGGRSGGC